MALGDGVHHVTVDGVEIEGSFPPWVAWTDMKGSEGQSAEQAGVREPIRQSIGRST